MSIIAGVDIGGTKCAVSIAEIAGEQVELIEKVMIPTPGTPQEAISFFIKGLKQLMTKHQVVSVVAVGISSGGPLDSEKGLILSPPNLPGWDRIDIVTPLKEAFQVPVLLQNDANACALAEWSWGAGMGSANMVFLTFGTGMGAGLILNSRLYSGTNGMAGEVGHIRLEADGPEGYGKRGSFEGFCSGGGIARMAQELLSNRADRGESFLKLSRKTSLADLTTKDIAQAAEKGDAFALEVFRITGEKLGKGLSILVDVLNPEKIVIGSIYARQQKLLEPYVLRVLQKEALPVSMQVCTIVPSGLGERVGDYASLSVAMEALRESQE